MTQLQCLLFTMEIAHNTILAGSIDGHQYGAVLVALAISYDGDQYDIAVRRCCIFLPRRLQCTMEIVHDTVLAALVLYNGDCLR